MINVNGGIVFSGNSIAFHNNSESGIINICNTTIESAVYDLSTTAGIINYNSNINTWLNGNTPTIKSGTEYINSLDNLVCE